MSVPSPTAAHAQAQADASSWSIPAYALAAQIRAGTSSAIQAVSRCLDRIQRHNGAINAVVTLDAANALARARALDALQPEEKDALPLLGVPVTIKDAFETAGIRTTSSHPALAQHVPAHDAAAVARLKAAGAIVLGKTNLPELAGDPQCWSPLFGPTNNPWDLTRTSGGSSGGSAAAIAMGFSALEMGSDIGGSIRIPAAFCGVAGFKATENRIPRTGHIPHLPSGFRSVRHLLSFGVLARCVSDLRLGASVIAGPDGVDSEVPPLPMRPERGSLGRPVRIAWWDEFAGLPLSAEVRASLASTVERLGAAGMTVTRACPEGFDFEKAWRAYGDIGGVEVGLGLPSLERRIFSLAGRLLPRSQPLTRAVAVGLALNMRRYNQALNQREKLIESLERFLNQWDAWLCPVAPTVAYPHRRVAKYRKPPTIDVDGNPISYFEATIGLTTPFSLTGSPVVVVPCGPTSMGLPFGVQLVGRRWADEELLDVAEVIEQALPGFAAPVAWSQSNGP